MENKDRRFILSSSAHQQSEEGLGDIYYDPRTGVVGVGKSYGEYTFNNRPIGAVSLDQTEKDDPVIDESTGYIVYGKTYGEHSFNNRPTRSRPLPPFALRLPRSK
jgi:hypothetical protein